MKRKNLFFKSLLIVLILIMSVGCGSSDKNFSGGDYYPGENKNPDGDVGNSSDNNEAEKVITTMYIEMQTKEFTVTSDKLNDLISKYKGYVESSEVYYNDYVYGTGLKYSRYSIRVPKENLDLFVNDVVMIGNIISKNRSKQDITAQYRDSESRLRVVETKEERLLALLEKADKMEDIIALENQLSDVIYKKENLIQQIGSMDDQVEFSSVNLELAEVAKLSSGGNLQTPFIEKFKDAFSDSIYFFTKNIGDLLIGAVYLAPYIIIGFIAVFTGYKLLGKKRDNKFNVFNKDDKKDGTKEDWKTIK